MFKHGGDDILERDGSKESGRKKTKFIISTLVINTHNFGSTTYCHLAPDVFTRNQILFSLLYFSLLLKLTDARKLETIKDTIV